MMKIAAAIAFLLALQATSSSTQSYAGSWVAEASGTTFVRLELQAKSDAMTGRISVGNFQLDAQGEIAKASPAPPEFRAIFDVVRRGSRLSFRCRDRNDVDQFELEVTGADAATLVLLVSEADKKELAASGIGVPKPIRLKRISR